MVLQDQFIQQRQHNVNSSGNGTVLLCVSIQYAAKHENNFWGIQLTFSMRGQCSALLFVGPTWVSHHTMEVTVHDTLFVGRLPVCIYF